MQVDKCGQYVRSLPKHACQDNVSDGFCQSKIPSLGLVLGSNVNLDWNYIDWVFQRESLNL